MPGTPASTLMAVLLALASAVSYGLSDFLGGIGSRRTSPWAVALLAAFSGAAAVLVLSLFVTGSPTGTDLSWGVAGGVGNGVGTVFLYRGLRRGRMGVVGPISGVGAAVVPVAAGVIGGERPSLLVWVGILAALPGIWLVAQEPPEQPDLPGPGPRPDGGAVTDGLLAGLGFGFLFATLGQVPDSAGLVPLVLNLGVAGLTIMAMGIAVGADWVPRERPALIGLVCGLLGAAATGTFMVAAQLGQLTISAVLASLYPAFTVLLAALVLREPIHRVQAVGLALCGAAIVLVVTG